MKIRKGFVSNSSTMSFVVDWAFYRKETDMEFYDNVFDLAKDSLTPRSPHLFFFPLMVIFLESLQLNATTTNQAPQNTTKKKFHG